MIKVMKTKAIAN